MSRLFSFIFFFTSFGILPAQTDFTSMHLKVWPDTVRSEIKGKVRLRFFAGENRDSVGVNGIKMTYSSVKLNGSDVRYDHNDEALWFPLSEGSPDTNLLEIEYTCTPRKGIFFIGWDDETGQSPKQIWTQGQGIDHRHWIPHKDDQTDKLTIDIEVEFDSAYQVISNGELAEVKEDGTRRNWHYHMNKPMSSYLIALAIGKYNRKQTQSAANVPLSQYYYPERKEDYQWYYAHNENIFNFMQKEVGVPFPWTDYKQVPVKDFHHGAMENTTATIFGDFFMVDEVAFNDRNYTYVNAHELAHQWFGNLITATGSDHHWLHEGFATYYQWLSEENIYGKDHFDWLRWEEAQLVFEASRNDSIPLGNGKAGSHRFYQKGAWVLYMLKEKLGKEKYDRAIQHYLRKNAFGVVNTDSLNTSLKATTGKDFSHFFNDWVFTAGEPVVKFSSTTKNGTVELHYTPVYMPFESVPVNIMIQYENGASVTSYDLGDEPKIIKLKPADNSEIRYWVINPGMEQLMIIEEKKPYPFWRAQFEGSSSVIDRYHAVKGMGEDGSSGSSDYLVDIVKNSKEFYAVRAEALKQLQQLLSKKEFNNILLTALQDTDIQLCKDAILLVKDPDREMLKTLHKLRQGKSYELRENALHLCIDAKELKNNKWLYDEFYEEEPGIPGHKVEVTALLYRLLIFKDTEALQTLKNRTSPTFDFITRMNAMQAMNSVRYFDADLCGHYFNALFAYNWQLRREARNLLQTYYQQKEEKEVIEEYIQRNENTFSDFQKRVVSATFDLNKD
ncbi:MAG: M1 family aminopeptidase [Owenweeksia sp.]